MACIPERIKASIDKAQSLPRDLEAFAILGMNDACVQRGFGQFFYLPEYSDTKQRCVDGQWRLESIIPNLLYARCEWNSEAQKAYRRLDIIDRYLHIQRQLPTQLPQMDVLPISLIMQDFKMAGLTWPTNTTARAVIYGPGPWYKLASISEWVGKATTDEVAKTCKITMYQPGRARKGKSLYKKSGNAIGKTCGSVDLSRVLDDIVYQSKNGKEEGLLLKGAEIVMLLAHEEGGEGAIVKPPK
ncbi:hypothetical protein ACLMJK_000627 [Lecanora helva]